MKVLLIRPNRNEVDAAALEKLGFDVEVDPYLEIASVPNQAGARRLLEAVRLPGERWLVLTSTNALAFWGQLLAPGELESAIQTSGLRFAAIGSQTKKQLEELGAREVTVASRADGKALAQLLALESVARVVIPSGSIAMRDIPDTLSAQGFEVISEVVYATELKTSPPSSVAAIAQGEFDAVLLRSPSAVRAFLKFNPDPNLVLCCAGRTTAAELENFGLSADLVTQSPDPDAVAKAICDYFEVRTL